MAWIPPALFYGTYGAVGAAAAGLGLYNAYVEPGAVSHAIGEDSVAHDKYGYGQDKMDSEQEQKYQDHVAEDMADIEAATSHLKDDVEQHKQLFTPHRRRHVRGNRMFKGHETVKMPSAKDFAKLWSSVKRENLLTKSRGSVPRLEKSHVGFSARSRNIPRRLDFSNISSSVSEQVPVNSQGNQKFLLFLNYVRAVIFIVRKGLT